MKQKSVKQNGGFENQIKTKGGWLNLSLISGVTASKKKSMMAKKNNKQGNKNNCSRISGRSIADEPKSQTKAKPVVAETENLEAKSGTDDVDIDDMDMDEDRRRDNKTNQKKLKKKNLKKNLKKNF